MRTRCGRERSENPFPRFPVPPVGLRAIWTAATPSPRRLTFFSSRITFEIAMKPSPKEVLRQFIAAFNRADAEALADLYAEDAINHQVAERPVQGRAAIRKMFADSFAKANMVCIVENIFEDGEWAILEWRDPLGLRGCGFFHVVDGRIIFQRGYWDMLTFLRQHGLPLPAE